MPGLVGTYNVLAPSYARREWYPITSDEELDPARRLPAMAEHLVPMGADMLCLQEVEAEWFAALDRRLAAEGYAGDYCPKGLRKPDGCAAFFRKSRFTLRNCTRLEYDDSAGSQPASGHVAQLLELEFEGGVLGVANTHLKWDPPSATPALQYGLRQMRELLDACPALAPHCTGWLVCGDLNVTPDSEVLRLLESRGFASAHPLANARPTCNPNRRAKCLDYVFGNEALSLEPCPLPAVRNETPLPGPEQPSDHVALLARCGWT